MIHHFRVIFLTKVKAEGTSLSCQLKLAFLRIWLFSLSLSPDFLEQLSFHLVARDFSLSDSILVWSLGPSAGAQSKPMAYYKFYLPLRFLKYRIFTIESFLLALIEASHCKYNPLV